MDQLKNILTCCVDVRGVVKSSNGDLHEFHNSGVKDLFSLLETDEGALKGAIIADRVVGRGAALLMVKGHVAHVYALLISESALEVLKGNCVSITYEKIVPNIINRSGNDICPIEKLTSSINNPQEAFVVIKNFLTHK